MVVGSPYAVFSSLVRVTVKSLTILRTIGIKVDEFVEGLCAQLVGTHKSKALKGERLR